MKDASSPPSFSRPHSPSRPRPRPAAHAATRRPAADKIVVWLQIDAQNGWPAAVAAANKAFKAQHPGVDVNVQYQTWNNHSQKFDAALAAATRPT